MLTICNEGVSNIFNCYFGSAPKPSKLYVGLYTNTSALPHNSTLNMINELSATSYQRNGVNGWNIIDSTSSVWLVSSTVTFIIPEYEEWNFYGYFVTNVASGNNGILFAVTHYYQRISISNQNFNIKINIRYYY